MQTADTPLARQVRAIMESGGYVSDEITNADRCRPARAGRLRRGLSAGRLSAYAAAGRRPWMTTLAEAGSSARRGHLARWPTPRRSSRGCSSGQRSRVAPTTTRRPSGSACRSTPIRPRRCSRSTARAACWSRSNGLGEIDEVSDRVFAALDAQGKPETRELVEPQ